MGAFTHDPLGHALYSYPWGEQGPLQNQLLRRWQYDTLLDIGSHLANPETRFTPLQIAVASGHGIGKSALISMITNWGLDTCEDCRVVITANTEGQLRTKTSPEVSKWRRLSITGHWYNIQATSISMKAPEHEKSWRCDLTPWSAANPEAFAGLHNLGKRIIIIMDEGSSIDDVIWETVEGALTDAETEIIWIVFGNPTRATGRFRECFRKYSRYWLTRKIDSRTVEGTNKKKIQEWQDVYGEDSDFFKVRVRGEFPNMSETQFISQALMDGARGRHLRTDQYDFAPKVIAVDPAWTGSDKLIISCRQGLKFDILEKIPKNDNDIAIANKVARYEDELQADGVSIDGGFGTGIYSAGQTMGRDWLLVWFNESSSRLDCVNKRAEMYVMAKEWLKAGGCVPDDDELYEEALAITTMPMMDGKYKFPPKDAIKELIGRSPGVWDSLCISFAHPFAKKHRGVVLDSGLSRNRRTNIGKYDPYSKL